jgi:hypothetical protein
MGYDRQRAIGEGVAHDHAGAKGNTHRGVRWMEVSPENDIDSGARWRKGSIGEKGGHGVTGGEGAIGEWRCRLAVLTSSSA